MLFDFVRLCRKCQRAEKAGKAIVLEADGKTCIHWNSPKYQGVTETNVTYRKGQTNLGPMENIEIEVTITQIPGAVEDPEIDLFFTEAERKFLNRSADLLTNAALKFIFGEEPEEPPALPSGEEHAS